MPDREKVIADIEEQIAWIRGNDFHKIPGWGHAVFAMRDALALLKEQEAVVLCKDCEHCYFASNRIPSEQNYACGKHGFDVAPDWYCADGERKFD